MCGTTDDREAVARSRSTTRSERRDGRMTVTRSPPCERRSPAPLAEPATALRLPCAARTTHARGRAQAAGKSEMLDRYAADYPQGPARPAAEHVPGLRLAARRPAHAAHGDDPLGLGLLRLRPDLHLAFLRRAAHGRLRAVQFRDAGHRQAVRGHPRRGLQAGRPGALRRGRRHQSLRADRLRRAAASCCRRRSTACASSASTCRASACRRMPRPRTCWPARC